MARELKKRKVVSAQEYMQGILNDMDEQRAKKLRHDFGLRHWILSWQPSEEGAWLARLSGPGCAETVERTGRTRSEAIAGALRVAVGSKS
jgi:hypothetical protein